MDEKEYKEEQRRLQLDLSKLPNSFVIPKDWCFVDKCLSEICGGPHREILTTRGYERIRYDQDPKGDPLK